MGEQIEEETYTKHFEELGVEAQSFTSDHHISSRIIHARYHISTISIDDTLSTEQIKIPPTVTNTRDNYTIGRYLGFTATLRYIFFTWHFVGRCHCYIIDHHACLRPLNTIDNFSFILREENQRERVERRQIAGLLGEDDMGLNGRQMRGEENLISRVVLARLQTHSRLAWTHYCFAGRSSCS